MFARGTSGLALLAFFQLGCHAHMVATPGGDPSTPYAPVNERQRGGVIKYRNAGLPGIRRKRRENAYKQMYEACGGTYRIDAEGPRSAGGRIVSDALGGAEVQQYEDWYIQFSCVSPASAQTPPASAPAPASTDAPALSVPAPGPLLIFGGEGHQTFLGCLTCSEFDADSVHNEFGTYGNEFNPTSIRSEFGQFGSEFSNFSACNPYAGDPPVVVDRKGGYHGRLTLNEFRDQIHDSEAIAWLSAVCHH
jgi:hypothetical protein